MDNVDETVAELTAKFRAMGADDPESWAASEIQEDIPQLGRFLFLRNIWPNLIDTWTADVSWVERLSQAEDEPFADAWLALKRSREAGVEDEDISRIARWVAYETVFGLLYHMADPQNESPEGMQFPRMGTHGDNRG